MAPDVQQSFIDNRTIPDVAEDENDMPELMNIVEHDSQSVKRRRQEVLDDVPVQMRRSVISDVRITDGHTHDSVNVVEESDEELEEVRPTESRASAREEFSQIESRARARTREEQNSRERSRSRSRTEEAITNREAPATGDVQNLITWYDRNGTGERIEKVTTGLLCFLENRVKVPMALNAHTKAGFESKNTKKEKRGKTLRYANESKEVREGLDISRRNEWFKWKQFTAGQPCRGKELQKLLDEGHVPVPTQWIEIDRNAFMRRDNGPAVDPDYKSRLVGRGDLEGLDGLRKDSPTADTESHNLLFSFAASYGLDLETADISNAYFQGSELDRLLLLKPPPGGLPDPEYADGETMILARVPIYGTEDAGRKFWIRLKTIIVTTSSGKTRSHVQCM